MMFGMHFDNVSVLLNSVAAAHIHKLRKNKRLLSIVYVVSKLTLKGLFHGMGN